MPTLRIIAGGSIEAPSFTCSKVKFKEASSNIWYVLSMFASLCWWQNRWRSTMQDLCKRKVVRCSYRDGMFRAACCRELLKQSGSHLWYYNRPWLLHELPRLYERGVSLWASTHYVTPVSLLHAIMIPLSNIILQFRFLSQLACYINQERRYTGLHFHCAVIPTAELRFPLSQRMFSAGDQWTTPRKCWLSFSLLPRPSSADMHGPCFLIGAIWTSVLGERLMKHQWYALMLVRSLWCPRRKSTSTLCQITSGSEASLVKETARTRCGMMAQKWILSLFTRVWARNECWSL